MCLSDLFSCGKAFPAKSSSGSDCRIQGSPPSQCTLPVSVVPGLLSPVWVHWTESLWVYWSHLNPLAEPMGLVLMLRLHLPFPGGWYTVKSWTAPNVFMLPTSRDTFPMPWRPNRTALPASQPTYARRPDYWWCYKGERWKPFGDSGVGW